jgi:predicted ribosome quality control (RQC) complex YloA/Tae2 family protein
MGATKSREHSMPEVPPPSVDALTLAAIAQEVRALMGARFAGVRQVAPDALALGLRDARRTHPLFFSIHPRAARVHFAPWPETPERLGLFGTLLRSRLGEARLTGVEQPPFDRVLRLRFEALEGPLTLIAEIMGRHSNLVLADVRVVLGALKVVTARMSPRRPVLPGRPYAAPPADRPRPDALDEAAVHALLRGDRPLARLLSEDVLGLGPLLAREVALRAGVDPALPAADAGASAGRIFTALREIAAIRETEAFHPTLYEDSGGIAAFAPIPLRIYAALRARPAGSMSEAVDAYFTRRTDAGPLEERRRSLAGAVGAVLRQREAALTRTREALAESRGADRLRVMGDLLLTYGSRAGPRDETLTVPDHTREGAEITIPLDPALGPAKTAQQFFRRYAKARASARALPARIAHLEGDILGLREARVQIDAAVSAADLEEIHADLTERGFLPRRPGRARRTGSRALMPGPAARAKDARRHRAAQAATAPRRFTTAGGATIIVGRSARENDRITFRLAGPEDLWFHVRGMPGAHVILKAGRHPSDADIAEAARMAAFYSEGRDAGEVAVDCVPRKHVRKQKGGPPGAVVYRGERTLRVSAGRPPR